MNTFFAVMALLITVTGLIQHLTIDHKAAYYDKQMMTFRIVIVSEYIVVFAAVAFDIFL